LDATWPQKNGTTKENPEERDKDLEKMLTAEHTYSCRTMEAAAQNRAEGG